MPIIQCYVDEKTLHLLKEASFSVRRTVEDLCESAISEEVLSWSRNETPEKEKQEVLKFGSKKGVLKRPCRHFRDGCECGKCPSGKILMIPVSVYGPV